MLELHSSRSRFRPSEVKPIQDPAKAPQGRPGGAGPPAPGSARPTHAAPLWRGPRGRGARWSGLRARVGGVSGDRAAGLFSRAAPPPGRAPRFSPQFRRSTSEAPAALQQLLVRNARPRAKVSKEFQSQSSPL